MAILDTDAEGGKHHLFCKRRALNADGSSVVLQMLNNIS